MKRIILLVLLVCPVFFVGCDMDTLSLYLDDLENLGAWAFGIALLPTLLILTAHHFDFDLMSEVSDYSMGCVVITFCIFFFGVIFFYMCS